MALVIDTTQPAHRVVSSVKVDPGEGHDFVHVFNRGARSGTIVVQKGDGTEIARRLKLDPMRVLAGVQDALAQLYEADGAIVPEVLSDLEAELVKLGSE